MSEPSPEPGAPAAGGFLSRRFLGIPAMFWLLGAVLIAYLYFRNRSPGGSSGASSTGSGTSSTGDISIAPATSNYTINVPGQKSAAPPRHRTPNPQPKPKHKPTSKVHQKMVPVVHGSETENDTGSG